MYQMNELIQFCKVRCYDEEVSIEATSHSLRIKISSVVGKNFFLPFAAAQTPHRLSVNRSGTPCAAA